MNGAAAPGTTGPASPGRRHAACTPPGVPGAAHPRHPRPEPAAARGHVGRIVAASLAIGLTAALALVAAPFVRPQESELTGAVLGGFALGWAMLALLSSRRTDQPQRWAVAPALLMGLGGLLLMTLGPSARGVLDWLWPPALLSVTIWTALRARRQLRSRSGRLLLSPVIAAMGIASIGGGYATVGAAADARATPMPGRLLDVGGHRLHLSCSGSGAPTVVLEAGGGGTSALFGWIAPAVAQDTRVCVYDRAGRGWSEPADTPQDAAQIATDLRTLLRRGDVEGPYVLAGHSFGGLYALTFAARYPDEVAGMVLVDSTAPASGSVRPGTRVHTGSYDLPGRISALVSASAHLGVTRLYGRLDYGDLPPRSRDEARARGATAASVRSTIDEYAQAGSSMEQAAALDDFAGKPLVVLTAGDGHDGSWFAAQDALATLSSTSSHRVVEGATHASLILDEVDSAATSRAILDVVRSVRTRTPLPG